MTASKQTIRPKATITVFQVEGTQTFFSTLEKAKEAFSHFEEICVAEWECERTPISRIVADEFQDNLERNLAENAELKPSFDYKWLDSEQESAFKRDLEAVINKHFEALILTNGTIIKYHDC